MACVLMLLVAACSDTALEDFPGPVATWLHPSTTAVPGAGGSTLPASPVSATKNVDWWNDDLGVAFDPTPEAVIARVADRASPGTQMVQASRFEIALALPDVRFPSVLPTAITSVTSQLVIDPGGTLNQDEYAVFGFWDVEPYTRSRTVGQAGTLTIGPGPEDLSVPIDCGVFADASACTVEILGDVVAARSDRADGQVWVWDDGSYRNELFLRHAEPGVADTMITGAVPLADLVAADLAVLGIQIPPSG